VNVVDLTADSQETVPAVEPQLEHEMEPVPEQTSKRHHGGNGLTEEEKLKKRRFESQSMQYLLRYLDEKPEMVGPFLWMFRSGFYVKVLAPQMPQVSAALQPTPNGRKFQQSLQATAWYSDGYSKFV
jgi:hypothetical protein